MTEAQIEQVKEDYPYLDKPLVVQYGYWLKDIVTGDWGRSYVASQSVVDMFKQRMPSTVFIAFWAIVIGLLIAVPLGVYSAYRRDGLLRPDGQPGARSAFISMPPLVSPCSLLFLVVTRFGVVPDGRALAVRRPVGQPGRALQELLHPVAHARHRPRARCGAGCCGPT